MNRVRPRCIFDDATFHQTLDTGVLDAALTHAEVYATEAQRSELLDVLHPARRSKLLCQVHKATYERIGNRPGPAESNRADFSFAYTDELYVRIVGELAALKPDTNVRDALIAETALRNQLALVTEDPELSEIMQGFGLRCMHLRELLPD
jgi:hypothetical protein